jgi:hypothetical protein
MANRLDTIVTIGDLGIFIPEDLADFELERAPGESDEDFWGAGEMYGLLFSAARFLLNRSHQPRPGLKDPSTC